MRVGWVPRLLVTIVALAVSLLQATGVARGGSETFASLNSPGPPLDVPTSQLASALSCAGGVAAAGRDPVLLVPGTALDPTSNYSWNYELGLSAAGLPWCALSLPNHGMTDIATAGEYVVYAIRTMAAMSGRQVDILGYSQGGMVPRWALRFWPDTRSLVRSFVALDPSNHGTLDSQVLCGIECPPAFWQQATGSSFLAALNSYAETFSGIDYSVIYSQTDEVVVPNFGPDRSSPLQTGEGRILNVAVQQVCPADLSEHLLMGTVDPVAYALAVEALKSNGLADPGSVSPSVCSESLAPEVNAAMFPVNFASELATIATSIATSPEVSSEPSLPAYVYGS